MGVALVLLRPLVLAALLVVTAGARVGQGWRSHRAATPKALLPPPSLRGRLPAEGASMSGLHDQISPIAGGEAPSNDASTRLSGQTFGARGCMFLSGNVPG